MSRLWRVVCREMEAISSRPLLWVVFIGVPLFSTLFMATIFGSGSMEELPIGVIDLDASPTSRRIIRTIDSSPTLHITSHPTSPHEATEEMKSGAIYGYVVLPKGLARAVELGESVTIPYYYHYALMSVGGEVATSLRTILTIVGAEPIVESAMARGVGQESIESVIAPTKALIQPLGNPALNYTTYLSTPFFFIMFQIVILITTLYMIGGERDSGSARVWLEMAGGSTAIALVGKLSVIVLIFTLSGCVSVLILNHFGALSVGVDRACGYMILLIMASVALAEIIYAVVPITGVAISIVSMIGSLGATLSGVTFPVASMYPIFTHLATLLPVRHFTLLLQYGADWRNIAPLALFALFPLLTIPRLHKILTTQL